MMYFILGFMLAVIIMLFVLKKDYFKIIKISEEASDNLQKSKDNLQESSNLKDELIFINEELGKAINDKEEIIVKLQNLIDEKTKYFENKKRDIINQTKLDICNKLAYKIIKVLNMTIKELKEVNQLCIYQDEENDKKLDTWTIYTEMCSLGGCEIGGITFPDEITAYRAAAGFSIIKGGPDSDHPCSECYSEYLENCI